MTQTLVILETSDLAIVGPDPFASNASRSSTAMSSGTTLKLSSTAALILLSITDNDLNLEDGESGQKTLQPVTVDGVTYPAGTSIEAEYSYRVRPDGQGGPDITVHVLEFDGDLRAIATNARLQPGTTYRIVNGGGSYDPVASYQSPYVCFAEGTPILTPRGWIGVERLQLGDLVATADDGAQAVLWHGSRRVLAPAGQGPVTIRAGVLGNGADVRVSPQHRVLLRLPGAGEVLVPAKALVGMAGVLAAAGREAVTWHNLAFARHQVLSAGGVLSESLCPGPCALQMLGGDAGAVLQAVPCFGGQACAPARPLVAPGIWRRSVRQRVAA